MSGLDRPRLELMTLLRNAGSHVDRVIADALRRLGTDMLKELKVFSQTVRRPWDIEAGFTNELVLHGLRREIDDPGPISPEKRERVRQAIAVVNENDRLGVVAVVESDTAAIVYWNWTYGYTVRTTVERPEDKEILRDWDWNNTQSWVPPPQEVLSSQFSGLVTDISPGYRTEAEERAAALQSEIADGSRDRRVNQLLEAVKDERARRAGDAAAGGGS
ncbi:MAG: hypothetical protein OXG35_28675 [Acidobacteria bacterium]|nr:hypothetical protein [Acidobacteriota bacterium]